MFSFQACSFGNFTSLKDCDFVATWEWDHAGYTRFEVQSFQPGETDRNFSNSTLETNRVSAVGVEHWLGLGLSRHDPNMGDDLVVMSTAGGGHEVYWNVVSDDARDTLPTGVSF